jgi:hypothetical protein
MSFRHVRMVLLSLLFLFSIFLPGGDLLAQTPTGGLSGVVTDPSGGTIAKASVRLTNASGASLDATTNREGFYEFKGLPPGTYTLKAVAKGFALFTQEDIQILDGQAQKLNIGLVIQMEEEKVEVSDSSTKVDIAPSNNAGMVVMQGKDLEALSDDPDELQSELQTLAGPSAGPNGGQIYIDGFTAGTLPPKASIREIRINQNPFSAEYDKLGYGRIEILTKPGTDQFHGQAFLSGTTAAFNARNPFGTLPAGTSPPGNHSEQYSGNIGGPLSKKASFFFNIEGRNVIDLKIVDTPFVDPNTFQIVQFSDIVSNPGRRYNISPRLDYQLTPTNTLTARYQYVHNTDENEGTGQFNLAQQGFNVVNAEQTLQISDTQVVNAKIINETRFQFLRTTEIQTPVSTVPAIQVQGAFTTGGNVQGALNDALNRFEIQNYTSMALGKHFVKFGARARINRDESFETANFNGSFSFGTRQTPAPSAACPGPSIQLQGIQAYQQLVMGLANGQSVQSLINCGFGPTNYSVTASPVGNPTVRVNWFDAGLYAQDDWRVRPNLTVSYGLRFETQNNLSDHADFAPRLGIAWGIGGTPKSPPKTVLRAGFGVFYDRFGYDLVAQQQRLNGQIQQQFIVNNPNFYLGNIPPVSQLQSSGAPSTIYEPNSHLRTPYTMQTGVSIERQLGKSANLAVTYLNARGVHAFFTNNINAPDPANNGLRPFPTQGNIFQYQSDSVFRQNQLIVNSSIRMGAKLSFFGYYTLNYAKSDTGGSGYFPSNPYDPAEDYGRASFDVRHRVFIGGSASLPHAFRLSPFMIASSGSPFNVTTALDPFGDSLFNQRAAFATCTSSSPTVKQTTYGCFDANPQPGERIVPINFLTGPGKFTLNLRLSKSFGFGKKAETASAGPGGGPGAGGTFGRGPGGGAGPGQRGGFGGRGPGGPDANSTNHRYSLTFSVAARNIFNHVNLANPVGNLSSSLFGFSNGLAGQPFSQSTSNRRIDLQTTFSF